MMSDEQKKAAFQELLTRCRGSLIRLCLIYTDRQPDNVKDLFQDIVYNLWRGFSQLRDSGKAHSWVYSIAVNTARMHHRTRQRQPDFVEFDEATIATLIDSGEDEMIDTLYRLIDLLDDDERSLIFLYLDRVPLKDMARILHTTETAVKHKINRLKKKLKKMHEYEQ